MMNNPMMGNMMGNMMNNAMNNNPVMALMNVLRSGGNPQTLLNQMAQNNPQAQSLLQMIRGKNPQQLLQTAENAARERGTTFQQVSQQLAKQFGIQPPNF